jgi:hypothetical protein
MLRRESSFFQALLVVLVMKGRGVAIVVLLVVMAGKGVRKVLVMAVDVLSLVAREVQKLRGKMGRLPYLPKPGRPGNLANCELAAGTVANSSSRKRGFTSMANKQWERARCRNHRSGYFGATSSRQDEAPVLLGHLQGTFWQQIQAQQHPQQWQCKEQGQQGQPQ